MLTDLNLFQFKRFKDEYIELFPLTLLTGINGMGKSSVIQALMVLRQSFDRGDLQNNNKIVIEDKELVNLISPKDILYTDAESSEVSFTLSDDKDNEASWTIIAEGIDNSLPCIFKEIKGDIFSSSLFDSNFQYLNAERIGPRPNYDKLTINRNHSPIGCRGEFTANRLLEAVATNEIVQLDGVIMKGYSTMVYDQVSAWVSEIIYPGTKIKPAISDNAKINLNYTFKEQPTRTFNPMNIGFGFSYALPIILAVLTGKKDSLLIVENPEAHLHPKGQSRMGRLLALAAESGMQVIIESHSDHLLNGIRLATKKKELSCMNSQIHYFTNEKSNNGNYKISFAIEEDGKVEKWPSGFFDEWDNMLDELLR